MRFMSAAGRLPVLAVQRKIGMRAESVDIIGIKRECACECGFRLRQQFLLLRMIFGMIDERAPERREARREIRLRGRHFPEQRHGFRHTGFVARRHIVQSEQ